MAFSRLPKLLKGVSLPLPSHLTAVAAFRQPSDSPFSELGSLVPKTTSQIRSISTCNPEVQALYEQITGDIAKKKTPRNSVLHTLLQRCTTAQDVQLAFEALRRYRVLRCSVAHMCKNFSEYVSELIASASLQAGAYDLGLKTLWKHNNYGLSPSLAVAHRLLSHAKEQQDIVFMNNILMTMAKNSIFPTTKTADIVLRLCKEKDDIALLFKLEKFFHKNGVKLSPAVYDICISCAANSGNVAEVWQIQKWREKDGLVHTIASAFSCAKALLLQGNSREPAKLLSSQCKDINKRNKYLAMMVRVWPLELLSNHEGDGKEEISVTLKNNMLEFVEALAVKGIIVPVNVSEEYAKGL